MFKFKETLTLESLKNFFKVRDEDDNLDKEQVKATAVQTAFILITFLIVVFTLWYVGAI